MSKRKKRIIVATPTLCGGSWLYIERILEKLSSDNCQIFIIGLGKNFHKHKNFSYFSIPYPRYDKWGFIPGINPIIAFFWILPLFFVTIFFLIILRPSLVISNGCTSGMIIAPFVKLFKKPFVLMYHTGIYKSIGEISRKTLKTLSRFIDLAVVNSKGSFQDILPIMPSNKVIVSELWADNLFFESPIKDTLNQALTILFVGRLDKDKLCLPLIKIAEKLKNDKKFLFLFAGVGEYASLLSDFSKKYDNIKYLGYITNRERLRDLYQSSDLLWAFADETYLAIPALEALACGTPILVPEKSAILEKAQDGIKINHNLVPSEIGWIIDTDNLDSIINLIFKIKSKGISMKIKQGCRRYAQEKYSEKNLEKTVKIINKILN
ncbi:glycosyltransferase [Candidatus Parcubacteria bacterium]|nr:glycosyltransferase [Candidatus Parcubacteria bacterium]